MVLDNRNTLISLEFGVWLVCSFIAIGSYLSKYDIGLGLGLVTWAVFFIGILALINKL
jgi:hypothetical protein